MSVYCPKCWAKAKCLDSRCDPRTNTVRRRHECKEVGCEHRFTSVEIIVGEVDLRADPKASLVEIAWEIFDALGGDKSDEVFLESWQKLLVERATRKREKAAEKRILDGAKPRKYKSPTQTHPWRRLLINQPHEA